MKSGNLVRSLVILVLVSFIAPTATYAAGAISFTKFNQIFGSRSKYPVAKKDKLIEKLNGKTVVWVGRMQGKFLHFSRISLTLDMGDTASPRSVIVVLKRGQRDKLLQIDRDSLVKVKAVVNGYGKVKYHELIDGEILTWKEPKTKSPADVDPKDLRFPKKKPKSK